MGQLNCREIDDIKNEIQVNYMGCVNIAHLAPKYLKETKGSLIFILQVRIQEVERFIQYILRQKRQ